MRIALIGMSGTGKSYWSQRLAQTGFERFGCDDRIGRRLAQRQGLGDSSIEAIGRWMGLPFEAGYQARERQYLELEHRVLADMLDTLAGQAEAPPPPCVIDTTGSVIYLAHELLERLSRMTVVVHLAAAPEKRQTLLAAYRRSPRPVVWHGHFQPQPDEEPAAALSRCYMHLCDDRDRRYRRHAHLNLELPPPGTYHAAPETLLKPIQEYLEENAHAATP
jgi:shikimate kinase